MTTPSKPLLCRTNLRHTWEWAHTTDGDRFIRCRKCHKEKGDRPMARRDGRLTTGTAPRLRPLRMPHLTDCGMSAQSL